MSRYFEFEVEGGVDRDLGLLGEEPDTFELVIEPSIEVDGVVITDPDASGFATMEWSVELRTSARLENGADLSGPYRFVGLRPVTIRGLPRGEYTLEPNSYASDTAALDGMRCVGWIGPTALDLHVDTTIGGVLRFAEYPRLVLSATVPATPSASELAVTWVYKDMESWSSSRLSKEDPPIRTDGAAPWELHYDELGRTGPCAYFLLAHGDGAVDPGASTTNDGNASFYGCVDLVIPESGDVEARVDVVLAANAIVPADWEEYDPEDRGASCVVPVGAPEHFEYLWRAEVLEDGRLLYRSLLPDTEYVVPVNGNTFTTGGPGSIVVVE
ncbi:MAG: hypothetical protein R3F34_04060 [Planctomycetota bacterium]